MLRSPILAGEMVTPLTARASSTHHNGNIANIVNGSGLADRNSDGLFEHNNWLDCMWLSEANQTSGWIEFDFGAVRKVGTILIWNYNDTSAPERGVRKADVSIWTQPDGWKKILDDAEFDMATAALQYDDPTVVEIGGVETAKIRFDDLAGFDGKEYVGLSEVQFYKPRGEKAGRPLPANGVSAGVGKVTLGWAPGASAVAHEVYLGTSPNELKLLGKEKGIAYMKATLSGLAVNTTYFWRVDEVQAGGEKVTGDIWSFATGGIVGWWKFDENDGSVAHDSSGNNHNGALHGNCVWQIAGGKLGGAIELDGDGDYVEIADENAFDLTNEATIACWVSIKPAEHNWATIIAKGDSWLLSASDSTTAPYFSVNHSQSVFMKGTADIPTDQWHHIAAVYDGNAMTIYVDGKRDSTRPWRGGIGVNDYNVSIGENLAARGRFFKGLIDDVRIYSDAMDAKQIMEVYSGKEPILAGAAGEPKIYFAPAPQVAISEATGGGKSAIVPVLVIFAVVVAAVAIVRRSRPAGTA